MTRFNTLLRIAGAKTGVPLTAQEMAEDYAELAKLSRAHTPGALVFGPNNQDCCWAPNGTDADYYAANASVSAAGFSYYGRTGCSMDPPATATALANLSHLDTLTTVGDHYGRLSSQLGGKPAWLAAGAACTHAPEGTGWGAVNAFANVLWYSDALGRLGRSGVDVVAYQTLFVRMRLYSLKLEIDFLIK